MIWCISFFFSNFFVQYISLLFIGMLVVISVRGFLTNLMKVFLLLSIANFFPLDVAWISYISSVLDNITICFHPLLLGVGQLSCWGKNWQFHWKEANLMYSSNIWLCTINTDGKLEGWFFAYNLGWSTKGSICYGRINNLTSWGVCKSVKV